MEIVRKYFPGTSPQQLQQLAQFHEAIIFWNQRINLVSRKDTDHLAVRHILHSLAIARFVHFQPGDTILDVGTGGGFPGIPLAILSPGASFTLIDTIGKKVNAVDKIIQSLGIGNVKCLQMRAEDYPFMTKYVVSRAVTRLDRFVDWVKDKIFPPALVSDGNGIYYLKGGDLQDEISGFRNATIQPLNAFFSEAFFETKKLVYLPYQSLH
jgi:16S rRNA (guanine527-N7)-methyltransferase